MRSVAKQRIESMKERDREIEELRQFPDEVIGTAFRAHTYFMESFEEESWPFSLSEEATKARSLIANILFLDHYWC